MPARVMSSGPKPVTGRPATVMKPRSGGNMPDSRLNAVVLPAPFGPISACRVRSATTMSACATARMPPKLFASSRAISTGSSDGLRAASAAGSGASCAIARPAIAAASTSRLRNGLSTRSATPTRPVGENTMKPTKSRPKNNSQFGVQIERNSRNRIKNSAPSAGPRNERMPPITTIARSSPENATEIGSAEAKRWWNTDSVPASAVIAAETVKANSL